MFIHHAMSLIFIIYYAFHTYAHASVISCLTHHMKVGSHAFFIYTYDHECSCGSMLYKQAHNKIEQDIEKQYIGLNFHEQVGPSLMIYLSFFHLLPIGPLIFHSLCITFILELCSHGLRTLYGPKLEKGINFHMLGKETASIYSRTA